MSDRQQRIAEIVKSALERDQSEWPAFLAEACAGDPALRAEVDSFLQFQPEASQFIEQGALQVAAQTAAREVEIPLLRHIEGYEITSRIGVGGMGEVYLAQDIKLRRKVALKLVRAGMDSADLVSRFRHEERILASLNHPNIAQLFGAGIAGGDLPYFAMEYVEGMRIDEYCKTNALSVRARLELFRKVCAAVLYAHQRLIIHRDLKPSNILVTTDGEPKLLDFGIAKLLEGQDSFTRMQTTLPGVMTPDYASPEQVRGEAMTTSTDVYSLGVLLYVLLTGQRPYRLKTRSADEIARAITDQEPDRPSTALTKTDHPQSSILDPRSLRGDIDNIVLMALRKEPQRRYASVGQMSEDIRRYLEGLPVTAHKDTAVYRARKFIQRHKIGVAAAILVLLTLLGGIAATAWQARRALYQARVADEQRDRAEQINAFLQSILSAASPEEKGRNATVLEVLAEAAARIETEFAKQPKLKADALSTVGQTYVVLGDHEEGKKALRRALQAYRDLDLEESEASAAAMVSLTVPLQNTGHIDEAEGLIRKAIEIYRKIGRTESASLGHALYILGELYVRKGDFQKARPLLEEAVKRVDQSGSTANEDSALILISLGRASQFSGDLDAAEAAYRKAIATFRQLPARFEIRMVIALLNLGNLLAQKEEFGGALTALNEADRLADKAGPSSYTAASKKYLAEVYFRKQDYARAIEAGTKAIDICRAMKTEAFNACSDAMAYTGLGLTRTGQSAAGEPYLREALQLRRQFPDGRKHIVPESELALGECLLAQNRLAEAEPHLVAGFDGLKATLPADDRRLSHARAELVKLYEAWGKPELANGYR